MTQATSPADLAALAQEIAKMRSAYEARISQLESRMGTMEAEKEALERKVIVAEREAAAAKRAAPRGTGRDDGAWEKLSLRVDELEAERSQIAAAREETATRQAQLETAQQRIAATEERTETTERYRRWGGLPFDPIKLYDLPQVFEFHGYLRTGFGMNGKEGKMVAFQAPGAGAKYRLGNEAETYGELEFVHNWLNPDAPLDKPFVSTHVMLGIKTTYNDTYDSFNNTESGNDIALRQAYIRIGNVFAAHPEVSFWAGQRYYQRHDIHINDFFFLDTSGYGGGVENIPIGDKFAKLHLAWLGGSYDRFETSHGGLTKQMFDLRLDDISVPGGKLLLWATLARQKGGEVLNVTDPFGDPIYMASSNGWSLGLIHRTGEEALFGGYNQFTLQYGRGAGFSFSPSVHAGVEHLNRASHFRVTNHFTIQPVDWFSMQAVMLYDHTDFGHDGNATVHWASAGLRPIFHLTRHFGISLETGVDWVDNGPLGKRDYLWKITLAPQLSREGKFFSRPVIRPYITYAKWGSDFRGLVGGNVYRHQTHGLSYGISAETWW